MSAESLSRWTVGGAARALGVAIVALATGGALGYAVSHERVPQGDRARSHEPAKEPDRKREERSRSPAEHALVAPLTEDAALEDFTVIAIDAVEHGRFRVVCARGAVRVNLDVALASDVGPSAPAKSGRYAIYYSLEGASAADGERLARALARILDANASAKAPAGMTTFAPPK